MGNIRITRGKINRLGGLKYYAWKGDNIFTLHISDIYVNKRIRRKVIMAPDCNHERPHIHVANKDNPKDAHAGSSIAIDNVEVLAGTCDDYHVVKEWIEKYREDLTDLWNELKNGNECNESIEKLKNSSKKK